MALRRVFRQDVQMTPNSLSLVTDQADRLDRCLGRLHPTISRAQFQRLIAAGHVRVADHTIEDAGFKVKAGQNITVTLPEPEAAEPLAETMALEILFEDRHLIVLNKPAGLVVHPAAGHASGTLVNALLAHCGEELSGIGGVKRPGIVHRLDKDTSGILVVAKSDEAHKGLSEQFAAHGRDGRLERAYLAFVWGVPERKSGIITTGIARSTTNRQKMAVSRRADAREAITHYKVVESFGDACSLVECRLETGRTHQIRVHMAHIGHPLLGDQLYASGFRSSARKLPAEAQEALMALNRQALHAAVLGFDHPVSGKHLHFESAPPPDMQWLLIGLRQIQAP
jgi:23S rRNA pseudouridine1911/1915/1917 synthase